MPDDQPISDEQAHERLVKATYALGTAPGATQRADSALKAARLALGALMLGLVKAMHTRSNKIESVKESEPEPRD